MTAPLICVDMDGTLLNGGGRIHPADVELLRSTNASRVIPTTGRPIHSMRIAFQRAGLWLSEPIPLAMVLDNGADCYLPGEKQVIYTPFEPQVMEALMDLMETSPHLSFAINTRQESQALRPPSALALELYEHFDFSTVPFAGVRELCSTKVTAVCGDSKRMDEFLSRAGALPVELVLSSPVICEVLPLGCHKAHGVTKLFEILGLSGAPILAAGDGRNDLELFDLAQRSFAPLTSPPEILARADQLIDVEKTGLLQPMLDWASRMA